MARVVGIHGIAQQHKGPEVLADEWGPPLRDGVRHGGVDLAPDELACAFYGDLFRPQGRLRGDPHFRPSDLTEDEAELLLLLWHEGARVEPERVISPDADVRAGVPRSVQSALRALARSSFFAGVAERAFIGALKQVRRYMREPDIRSAARAAVHQAVGPDTEVLVAHSLGSVVAFEALHEYGGRANWANVRTLVTLGSPLGIRNLIFEALDPPPTDDGGLWPPGIEAWTNVSDDGDVVALAKKLGPLFDAGGRREGIRDIAIDNGARVHDVMPYLTSADTGRAIADGLR